MNELKLAKTFAYILASVIILSICSIPLGILTFNSNDKLTAEMVSILKIDDELNNVNLDVLMKSGKFNVVLGDSLEVLTNNSKITAEYKDNEITIKNQSLKYGNNDSVLTLKIPEYVVFDKINLELGAGLSEINNLKANNWQIELGAGKFTFDNILATQKIMIEAGVGSLDIVNSDLNNLTLDGGVGKIDFSGYITGNSKIEVGIGKIGIDIKDTKENYALILEKGIGSIEVDGVDSSSGTFGNGKNTLNASGGIGKLEINFSK